MCSTPITAERVLTARQLAERCGVEPRTVEQWRYFKKGPPYFRVGRHVLYDLAAVEQWELETGRRGGDT